MRQRQIQQLRLLESWFQRQKRILPWRDQPTDYRVWISEIMLQQTQVATVIPYFERFMARFPQVEDLASAPESEVLLLWSGLGYYSRARNLHKTSRRIVEDGRFPRHREEWLEMPGVGRYTAGAILSIVQNQPEAILDGNVERVLSRVYRVDRKNGDQAFKSRLWQLSEEWVQEGASVGIRPSILNQALMELGALICSPKRPRCESCPLQKHCQADQAGDPESFPPKKKPKAWVHVQEEVHCVLEPEQGQVALRQRKKGEWREGLWDLLDENPQHLFQKLQPVGTLQTRHTVTHHKILRNTVVWKTHSTRLKAKSDYQWVSWRTPEVAVGSALKKTLSKLAEKFGDSL